MQTLADRLAQFEGPVEMLRSSQMGPYEFPIKQEFSNWRDEQQSMRSSVALLDQSFHMTDLYIEGPDAIRLVSSLSINGYKAFGANKAKQIICCDETGHLIGDLILFALTETCLLAIGRPTVVGWIEFHASLNSFDVTCTRDERKLDNPQPKRTFRFEIQGPDAWPLIEKLNGQALAPNGFFKMGEMTVDGTDYKTLQHGMGGAPGLELWGPIEDYDRVKSTILVAGAEFGLRQVGAKAYSSATVESGWWGCVFPAFYTGAHNQAFREWLPALSYDGMASLGGSFASNKIEDFHFTPWDLDYGRLIRFDHEFIGRDALMTMEQDQYRKKVSLIVDPDDAARVYRSQFGEGPNYKAMDMPTAHYAAYPFDEVLDAQGAHLGVSGYLTYLAPERAWVSLATIDADAATLGSDVWIVWGENDTGTRRPTVEPHEQTKLRAKVAGWPISDHAFSSYRTT